jgi:hypothetical protein
MAARPKLKMEDPVLTKEPCYDRNEGKQSKESCWFVDFKPDASWEMT